MLCVYYHRYGAKGGAQVFAALAFALYAGWFAAKLVHTLFQCSGSGAAYGIPFLEVLGMAPAAYLARAASPWRVTCVAIAFLAFGYLHLLGVGMGAANYLLFISACLHWKEQVLYNPKSENMVI